MLPAQVIGIISAILGILSYIPYYRDIFWGQTRPNRATFGILSFIGVIQVYSYIQTGATSTVFLPLIFTIGAISVFLISIKKGVGGASSLDIACLAGAVLSVIAWQITQKPEVALYLGILTSAFGLIPTIRKAYYYPWSESKVSWTIASVAAILNLFAISQWTPSQMLYPLYYAVAYSTLSYLTVFSRGRKSSGTVRKKKKKTR